MKIILIIFLGMIYLLPGCTRIKKLVGPQQQVEICAGALINQAYGLYGEAKLELARHYDNRDSNHLFDAYYAASDSILVARNVRKCPDRQRNDFFAVKNIIKLNRTLQRTVKLNMRDDESTGLIAIYRHQYDIVMPNDIK